jgi:hypothetical protein
MAALTLLAATTPSDAAVQKNGFDLTGSLISIEEIHSGGPPRDGIPAIDRPRFLTAAEAREVHPGDRVLGLKRDGMAKAYPIAIMNWHEIVNDRFGDTAVAVTFCPLCGTGMAFDATVGGMTLQFGVSGLLYNSDVLLYDRQSESLWTQIGRRAISGPYKGTRLATIPLEHTTWADWRARHPDTLALSRETGHDRNYAANPYSTYQRDRELYFPVRFKAQGYHPKERVLGVEMDGRFKAYPFSELAKTKGVVDDRIGEQAIRVRFDAEHENARAETAAGEALPAVVGFWFAWYAFHPETEVYKAKRR